MQSSTETPPTFRQASAVEEAISDQTATIEFLSKPESYVEPPTVVERIDTHAAIVFLASDKAYKLKRAVILPYLDFSTTEKRRQVCERELSLNQETAPNLYLRVLPVVRKQPGQALMLGGDASPLTGLIEMRRFDQNALFGRLASAGQLKITDIENLAAIIAAFHKDAPAADDFVACYRSGRRFEREETEKFRRFPIDALLARDKVNLDIFWLKDDALDDPDLLPPPDGVAAEILESLETALTRFRGVAAALAHQ